MGNKPSSSNNNAETEFENFYDVVDYVATYYILTMDFKSLSKLSEKEYCDKLIILTADILEKYLNERHITYLEQRVRDGVEVNTLNNEKFLFVDRDVFDGLDISHDTKLGIKKNVKKQRVCIGIAKFYVKIAHIFAAILMTINPVYSYTDSASGLTMKTTLLEKDKIPKGVSKQVLKLNVCDNRISSLRNKEQVDEETGKATLQPNICDLNVGNSGFEKNLADEPGIPELMQLYFDKYDDKTGTFTGMTEETEVAFRKDLQKFYAAFTGNETMPPEVTRFSDIKLRDYNKQPNCMGPDPKFRSRVRLNVKDDLFAAYAGNIKSMIQSAADNQVKLLEVINSLFTYSIDPVTQKRIIRVNPELSEESLKAAVEKTRRYIMELYVKCETDYENGVKLYEAIVESKNAEMLPRQIEILNVEADKLLQSAQPLGEAPAFIAAKEITTDSSTTDSTTTDSSTTDSTTTDSSTTDSDSSVTTEPMPPIEQPMLPPVEQPMLPPIEQPMLPPVEQPMLPPVEQPMLPPVEQPMLPPVEQPILPVVETPQINVPLKQPQVAGKKRTRKNIRPYIIKSKKQTLKIYR
jgi:hypothetical protein